jgi:hypothetical protein
MVVLLGLWAMMGAAVGGEEAGSEREFRGARHVRVTVDLYAAPSHWAWVMHL